MKAKRNLALVHKFSFPTCKDRGRGVEAWWVVYWIKRWNMLGLASVDVVKADLQRRWGLNHITPKVLLDIADNFFADRVTEMSYVEAFLSEFYQDLEFENRHRSKETKIVLPLGLKEAFQQQLDAEVSVRLL